MPQGLAYRPIGHSPAASRTVRRLPLSEKEVTRGPADPESDVLSKSKMHMVKDIKQVLFSFVGCSFHVSPMLLSGPQK